MVRDACYVGIFGIIVAAVGVATLNYKFAIGPIIFGLTLVPLAGLLLAKRRLKGAIPDVIFGAIDTGLLTVPALWGGALFGVAGAIAGGIIGDALTDGIAGFFEGGIAKWLQGMALKRHESPLPRPWVRWADAYLVAA